MSAILRAVMFIAIAALGVVPGLAQDQTPPTAVDMRYGDQNDPLRVLDVYVPEDAEGPLPVILYFHGYGRSKEDAQNENLPQVAEQVGAAVVAVNYSTMLPDTYADAWCAVSWVQANAETYGFDPGFIVPFGVSYGGLPATMLAAQDDPSAFLDCPHPAPDPAAVKGIVSLAGLLPSNLATLVTFFPDPALWDQDTVSKLDPTPAEQWMSLDLPDATRRYLSLWPVTWIDDHEPPHLLIHGAEDSTLPYQDSYDYATVLARNDTNVTVLLDSVSGHVPGPEVYDYEIVAFLQRLTASRNYVPGQQRPSAYNVLYGAPNEGGRRLDVYTPEDGEGPYPVVLMFHGSGADKSDMVEFGLPDIAARAGAATVAITYRTHDPAQAYTDAYCALAWVQAHGAEYDLDPSRLVVLGHSYGALPATMLAVQDNPPDISADCPHPAADPSAIDGVISIAGLLVGSGEAMQEFAPRAGIWQASELPATMLATPPEDWLTLDLPAPLHQAISLLPMAQIDANEPPHLLVHGTQDETIPYQQTLDYAGILSRNGTSATVVLDRYSGHVPPPFAYDREMIAFLQRAFNQPES
ncbi:MAG: alpha/beta hydrolase [Anaerolineae bacterium]